MFPMAPHGGMLDGSRVPGRSLSQRQAPLNARNRPDTRLFPAQAIHIRFSSFPIAITAPVFPAGIIHSGAAARIQPITYDLNQCICVVGLHGLACRVRLRGLDDERSPSRGCFAIGTRQANHRGERHHGRVKSTLVQLRPMVRYSLALLQE